ncbi:MAG: DUF4936 family protein [Burkholderiales bacterium]|jgi:hypothetical protein
MSCYIYYRVAAGHVAEASKAARATLDAVRECTGVDGQLMTKVDEPLLWMEVYAHIVDQAAFLDAMRSCTACSQIGRWLGGDGARHTELFQSAAPQTTTLPAGSV